MQVNAFHGAVRLCHQLILRNAESDRACGIAQGSNPRHRIISGRYPKLSARVSQISIADPRIVLNCSGPISAHTNPLAASSPTRFRIRRVSGTRFRTQRVGDLRRASSDPASAAVGLVLDSVGKSYHPPAPESRLPCSTLGF